MKNRATVTIMMLGNEVEVTTRSHTRVGARCYRVKRDSASQKRLEAVLERYGEYQGQFISSYGTPIGNRLYIYESPVKES